MRILFVTYRFPAYSGDASSNTVFNLVKYFSRSHEVSLVGLAPRTVPTEMTTELGRYCRRMEIVNHPKWRGALGAARGLLSSEPLQMWYFRSTALAAKVRHIISSEQIDIAYGYHLRSGQFLAQFHSIPRVIAIQPAQALHFRRRYEFTRNPILRFLYRMELRRLIGYEAGEARKFDSCLLISENDRNAVDPDHALNNIFYNPHGTDTDFFAPPKGNQRENGSLVFSGAMYMDTNSDAALYFCREILPMIWKSRPQVRFTIVGKNPPSAIRKLAADPRITVTGFVEDVRPYLWKASIGVNPMRMAAGLQNKLLEGLAAGLPMVVTPEANEGICAPADKSVCIAGNPEKFAAAVLELLDDPQRAQALATGGQRFVQAHWSWEAHFKSLESHLESLVHGRTAASDEVGCAPVKPV
jgi:polysaccharide biosynthesis protein PslH